MAAPRGASGRPPANAALRGALLIVVAVLIGLALMSWGFADEGGLVAGPDPETTEPTDTAEPTSTTDGTEPPSTVDGETTEVLPPPRDPSEVTALVLNGSGVDGAAGRVRDQLLSLNYTPRSPETASERVPETVIYYLETWRAEALQIAADLNVTTDIVTPMPVPAPLGVELGEATSILIILGEDGLIAAAAG